MKVLVTGVAGFIGSSLVLRLLERGDTVVGIDNHNDYYDPKLKEARLSRYLGRPNYTHLRIDLADQKAMDCAFETHKPNRVVNLAAQAGVRYSIENPFAYVNSNVVGFLHVLEGCRHPALSILCTPVVQAFMVPILRCRFLSTITSTIHYHFTQLARKVMN